ncbi:MAG TPA: hypothetical protein ENN67_07100, partial [Firmicutes bacterium]|nr:hypothetical protein [Bacillota bacterium]
MAFPAKCPVCGSLLGFPEIPPSDPIRCPICSTRYIMEGQRLAHLNYRDFYSLLDIAPNSDEQTIRKAIRTKVLQWHPDRNPDDPTASDKIREVIQAKELLTDKNRRRAYDRVYYAQALPIWSPSMRHESSGPNHEYSYRQPDPFTPGRSRSGYTRQSPPKQTAPQPHYAYTGSTTGRNNSAGDFAHGDIFRMYEEMIAKARARSAKMSGRDVDAILREMEWRDWSGHMGSGIGCLLGFLAGLMMGRPIAILIMAILGGMLGKVLGTYAKELTHVIFLLFRIYVFGRVIEMIVVAVSRADWVAEALSAAIVGIIYK